MTDDKNLIARAAKRLKKARQAKKLTQAEVAKKAGISENHYAQIERGEKNPSLSTFTSIIKALGISSAEILGK
jgi:transcriptional regulator with XRE-family HTH domain